MIILYNDIVEILKKFPTKLVNHLPEEYKNTRVAISINESFDILFKDIEEIKRKEIEYYPYNLLKRDIGRPKVFAIDYDSTINKAGYNNGHELDTDLAEFCMLVKKYGHKIIIWTCREGKDLDEAINFLNKNKIPYDFINCNPEIPWGDKGRKVCADYYIDDLNLDISIVKEVVKYERENLSIK